MDRKANKTKRLYIRISEDDKNYFESLAKRRCITITELFLSAAKNVTVKDYRQEEERSRILQTLSKEINCVGHNINQATIVLHQLRITASSDSGELKRFNDLQTTYQCLMEDYKQIIQKLLYHE
jgi:hypothetical protein